MTCDQFWEWSGSEDDALREQAERHFAECAQCQAARRELESTLSRLAIHPSLDEGQRRLWLQVAEAPPPTLAPRQLQRAKRGAAGIIATLTAVAALALFALMTGVPKPTGDSLVTSNDEPTRSPVVIIPLTIGLCFGQIELDLQAAETRLEEVSQALSLVEVQRDVQQTLEEARRWSD